MKQQQTPSANIDVAIMLISIFAILSGINEIGIGFTGNFLGILSKPLPPSFATVVVGRLLQSGRFLFAVDEKMGSGPEHSVLQRGSCRPHISCLDWHCPAKVLLQRLTNMKLGFIGTGEITAAMVTGLCSASIEGLSIRLSPRNHELATHLADRFAAVSIASSNQDVLASSDVVVIAVRPPISSSALAELQFRPQHCVISLVSSLSLRKLSELVAP
ncbi:MAG: NAD(P)-binding domain-containing protein, partial [Sinobacteraceae bacterium]|nr:NAD(P)-binding domain-containing protein [Nevskiaceae bacterium]